MMQPAASWLNEATIPAESMHAGAITEVYVAQKQFCVYSYRALMRGSSG